MKTVCSTREAEKDERESRSVALEKAYVHDVYDQLSHHFSEDRYRPWPRVRNFLQQLEPGSLVCDAGCGNGKYLGINPTIFKLGSDRCISSVEVAKAKDHEVLICDMLNLPYRDESFDAALSVAVIHHLATRDRRVRALRELARILRVGGRILITVWAKEQRHRKFESQDILVPWRTPERSSSEEKTSVHDQELVSSRLSTTTSDEDVTHYHAYTQTSESDSCHSCKKQSCNNGSDSIQSKNSQCTCPSDGTENGRRRIRNRHKGRSVDPHRPSCSSQSSSELSSPSDSCYSFVRKALQRLASTRRAVGNGRRSWFTIEESLLTEANSHCVGSRDNETDRMSHLPIELRHLDSEEDVLVKENAGTTVSSERSRSSPPSLAGGKQSSCDQRPDVTDEGVTYLVVTDAVPTPVPCEATPSPRRLSSSSLSGESASNNRSLSLSDLLLSFPISVSSWLKQRLSEEQVSPTPIELDEAVSQSTAESPPKESATAPELTVSERRRSMMTKQKKAVAIFESYCEEEDSPVVVTTPVPKKRILKQRSMNDYLLPSERLKEREKLRRCMPRQVSWAGEKYVNCKSPVTIEEAPIASSDVGSDFSSFKNGFVRIWQSLRGDSKNLLIPGDNPVTQQVPSTAASCNPSDSSYKPSLEDKIKSFCSWSKEERSPSRIPTNEEDFNFSLPRCCADQELPSYGIRAVTPTAGHSHRLSYREEGSDSSKDSSLQSDTSLDSEDSAVSVIYIPHPDAPKSPSTTSHNSQDGENKLPSLDSPKSPTSPNSPNSPKMASPTSSPKILDTPKSALSLEGAILPFESSTTSSTVTAAPQILIHEPPKNKTCLNVDDSKVKCPSVNADIDDPCCSSVAVPLCPAVNLSTACVDKEGAKGNETTTSTTSTLVKKVTTETGEKVPVLIQSTGSLFRKRSAPRLLSFEVFNPETDDIDSDSSSESSSDSAGSVISVGDPMWPAFQDRRQTILSGSSFDFVVKTDSEDLTDSASVKADDSVDSGNIETPKVDETVVTIEEKCVEPPCDTSNCCKAESYCDEDLDNGWKSSLGPLDECHECEEDSNETNDDFCNQLSIPESGVCQWKERVKSSFSISTSSLDSSFSAPSFSSARQSSSASAISEIRKNSDDSVMMSTLPLIRSRHSNDHSSFQEARSKADKTATCVSLSEEELRMSLCAGRPKLPLKKLIDKSNEDSLSISTSQDSLPSDAGGTVTLHRYYHVFCQGELDQLIERYVENLHIISSYYDHANWCIVAEKVHVWTI